MRLIDADVMHREIDKFDLEGRMSLKNIKRYINVQPTAYDIDKVVEQLEENYSCDVGNLKMISVDKAIEIVKGGAE